MAWSDAARAASIAVRRRGRRHIRALTTKNLYTSLREGATPVKINMKLYTDKNWSKKAWAKKTAPAGLFTSRKSGAPPVSINKKLYTSKKWTKAEWAKKMGS